MEAPLAHDAGGRDTEPPMSTNQGRLTQWLGARGHKWGTDPAELDLSLVERTVARAGKLFGEGRYFGLDVQGMENIPEPPVMIVSNHSGGTTIPDVWGFGVAWYNHFGTSRPIHPLAHEIILSTRLTGKFFGRHGVLRASRTIGAEVLTEFKRDLMVMPGGDRDTWRPYSKRYQVCFAGRTGYARLALKTGVPIVPVANAGAHETLIVLTDGQRMAKRLGLHKLARASIFPVHLSFPWGLTIGPWPHLPTPVTLRYRIGKPIDPPADYVPGTEPTDEQVKAHDDKVRAAVQTLLNQLKREDQN